MSVLENTCWRFPAPLQRIGISLEEGGSALSGREQEVDAPHATRAARRPALVV